MAKYSYPYKCGHGEGIINLIGKNAERQRQLAWYASTFVCPACHKKRRAEEDATAEKTASIHIAILDAVYISIQVRGQIAVNKQALYDLGYRWGDELDGGLMAMLMLKRPKRTLQKYSRPADWDDTKAAVKNWRQELAGLGYTINQYPTRFDQDAAYLWFNYRDKKLKDKKEQAENERREKKEKEKAEAEKWERARRIDPPLSPPAWYKDILENKKHWNGKFYGNEKRGWTVYINGKETKISTEEKEKFERHKKDLKEWKELWS